VKNGVSLRLIQLPSPYLLLPVKAQETAYTAVAKKTNTKNPNPPETISSNIRTTQNNSCHRFKKQSSKSRHIKDV